MARAYTGSGAPGAGTLPGGNVTFLAGDEYFDLTGKNFYVCDTAGSASGSHWTVWPGGGSNAGTVVMTQIATHDTGSAETSFTWSSLNGDSDKIWVIRGRVIVGTNHGDLAIQPNADTTAANYAVEAVIAVNGAAAFTDSTTFAGLYLGFVDTSQVTSFEYTLHAKSGYVREGSGTTAQYATARSSRNANAVSGLWINTTDNITSLKILSDGASGLGVGSHFELWAPRALN